MKKLIDKLIIQLSYKNPHLWLEINEMIFDGIEDHKKKQREKMYENVRKLKNKLKL
jgi:hypothetical protein